MATQRDERVRAYVRAHATLRLMRELDAETVTGAGGRRLSVQLRTPAGPACHITVRDGRITFHEHPRLFPSVTLWFPSPGAMATVLSGGKATVFPLPTSPGFVGAAKAFRRLSAALKAQFAEKQMRPRMLLLGTLYALQEVARHDPYVYARVARIPEGTIAVTTAEKPTGRGDVTGWVRKSGDGFATGDGPVEEPNAVLEFENRDAALALLTGETPAMLALAERSVRLYGRIPMVQNLFPILDRVAHYMGGGA